MTKEVVYIDGDICAYRCGFAAEHTNYTVNADGTAMQFDGKAAMNKFLKENPNIKELEWQSHLTVEPLDFVLSTVKHMVSNIVQESGAKEYVVYLSSKNNFRNDIATVLKYKGNRDGIRRPMHHDEVIRYLTEHHGAIIEDGFEADDLLAEGLLRSGGTAVLASIDKDLLQVPGTHFNFVNKTFQEITPEEGLVRLFSQMLTGDSTDNIPGIHGVGPVKAEQLLDGVSPEENALREAVTLAWHMYLTGERRPSWILSYDNGRLLYDHWSMNMQVRPTLKQFIDELEALLRVGKPDSE